MLTHIVLNSFFWMAQITAPDDSFKQLKEQLETYGFQVLIEPPPRKGAYGLFNRSSQTIWVHPVVFDLNIAMPTLVHEAIHAAQFCAGKGQLESLGLEMQPLNQARPFFQRYADIDRQDLEREAYTIQTQPNRFELVLSLLEEHCQDR